MMTSMLISNISIVKLKLTNVIDALLLDCTRVNAVDDSTTACSGHAMILSHQQTLQQNPNADCNQVCMMTAHMHAYNV